MDAEAPWRIAAQYQNAWQLKETGEYELRARLYILSCPRKHILILTTDGMTTAELGGVLRCQDCDTAYLCPSEVSCPYRAHEA